MLIWGSNDSPKPSMEPGPLGREIAWGDTPDLLGSPATATQRKPNSKTAIPVRPKPWRAAFIGDARIVWRASLGYSFVPTRRVRRYTQVLETRHFGRDAEIQRPGKANYG